MFEHKIILITGGTGSWGNELTRKLLAFHPKEIRILSRNAGLQINMRKNFAEHPSLRFIIGDIRDFDAVLEASLGVDYIFHLAALKHVPICEAQPEEAIKTNIQGTDHIIRAGILNKVKKVIDVSTDKAADPINFYGMTKSVGEKQMILSGTRHSGTQFVCIRGGNVLGSNGSVVPFFTKQIKEGSDIPITSKEMTRFFLTLSEAIDLVLKAAQVTIGGETFVMRMKACRIVDVADILIDHFADQPIEMKEIGIRPGEKIHEILVTEEEAHRTYEYDEHYFVILPHHPNESLQQQYGRLPKMPFRQYESNTNLMPREEMKRMLARGGFLQ